MYAEHPTSSRSPQKSHQAAPAPIASLGRDQNIDPGLILFSFLGAGCQKRIVWVQRDPPGPCAGADCGEDVWLQDACQPQHRMCRIKPAQGVKNLTTQAIACQSPESNICITVIIKSEQPPMFCPACNLNGFLAVFGGHSWGKKPP